jgi:hypothetical protein
MWSVIVGGDEAIFDDTADRLVAHARTLSFRAGDVILLHDPNVSTVEGLPAVIQRLDELSLVSVPLSALLNHTN